MIRLTAATAALCLMAAAPALSQQVTGGSLSLSHSAFVDETRVAKTALAGSVELGFSRSFSVQADLGFTDLNAVSETATTFTLHGVYHLSDTTSAGLFLGVDSVAGESEEFVGLEFGHQVGRSGFEAYVARAEEDGISGTMIGLSTRYEMGNSGGIGVSLDRAAVEGIRATRYSLNGDLTVADGMKLFGEVGALHGSVGGASDSEGYVKLGAKFTFGAKRGTTFGQRSILNVIPGL